MPRWPVSLVERAGRSRGVGRAVVASGLAVGVAAEWTAFSSGDAGHWVPDLVVGLAFVGAGASALRRRPGTGVLLAAAGFMWFAGTVVPALLYVHRGPLVHAVVAYPGWRPRSRLGQVAVVAGWAAAVTPVWRREPVALALGLALVVVAGVEYRRAARPVAGWATAVLGGTFAVGAAVRLVVPSGDAVEPLLLAYEAVLCGLAATLAVQLRPPAATRVVDLVVELGEAPAGTLRDALAVLVHDPSVLDDPALVAAVETATRLSEANTALQDDVRAHLAEVAASRRRLVVAADHERRRLEAQLRVGAKRRLRALAAVLGDIPVEPGSATGEHVDRARGHLAHTLDDLAALAQGLHPGDLRRGLPGALAALAERSPVPVTLTVSEGTGGDALAGDVAVAVYFVCAEAMSNVTKHARAEGVTIRVERRRGTVVIAVTDDGIGGADLAGGTGLRGLEDRVEALGGSLRVDSPVGAGTRLVAELPLGHQAPG